MLTHLTHHGKSLKDKKGLLHRDMDFLFCLSVKYFTPSVIACFLRFMCSAIVT
uniref:Uncharacterized protein n=1 Tax=Anguilla anguilla TaxID=7936 RepID=A0A0E9WDX7_ANGAN